MTSSHPTPSRRRRPHAVRAVAGALCAALLLAGAPAVLVGQSPSASPAASGTPAASAAPSTVPVVDRRLAAALQRSVEASRVRIPAPGISVAVLLPDGALWTGVAGDRQLSPPEPVTTETVFAIASITKTFVSAVVMQLIDEGRLTLDSRLSEFLPRYPRARSIRIRHLLGHTSGIADYFLTLRYAVRVFREPGRSWTPRQILGLADGPWCDPGACFRYSNTNFVLLGMVIEQVTGEDLGAVIRRRLLVPQGLDRTVFQPDQRTPRNAAHGHLWGGGSVFYDHTRRSRILPHRSAATVAWAAGAMASTATDLARWADALYGGRVVSEASLDAMLTFRKRDAYGLGTRTRTFHGHRAIGHLGGIRGYELAMWHFPEDDVTIVVLTNRGMYSTDTTVKLLVKAVFRRLDAHRAPEAAASPVPAPSPDPVVPSPSAVPAG